MKSRIIKRRLVKARSALSQTIQKILDISRKKKTIPFSENPEVKEAGISEELWLLNKLVKQQAQLVRHYETTLTEDKIPKNNFLR
jgi:hypothetical protein